MKCHACEEGDHDNCGMQTWCDCDCEGYDPYMPSGHYFADDLDGRRLVKKETIMPDQHEYKVDDRIKFRRVTGEGGPNEVGTVLVEVRDIEGHYAATFPIPPNLWASLVLTMSKHSERPNDWHAFMAHHQGKADLMKAETTIQTIENVLRVR